MQYQKHISVAISKGKDEYHRQLAQKLSDPSVSSKSYWSILKRLYNRKKVPVVSPLLINNKLESDFEIKANYFNTFFASECTPLNNKSIYCTQFTAMFLVPGLHYVLSMRKSFQKLSMILTLTKHMNIMIDHVG